MKPEEILAGARTIAVVGLSRDPGKAAHGVPASLQAHGFRIIPVHPSATELLGEKVYRTLEDIPEPVDLVDVFRPAEKHRASHAPRRQSGLRRCGCSRGSCRRRRGGSRTRPGWSMSKIDARPWCARWRGFHWLSR